MIGNGALEFKVIYAAKVRAHLEVLAQRAKAAGRAGFLLDALKSLDRRLRLRASAFGESLYTLKGANLDVRIGGVDFLIVRFGVHSEKKLVMVIDSFVLGDPGF